MSELVEKEILSDEYVNQIRTFGALNYTPERICQLLGLRKVKREALLYRISIPGDVYYEAYLQGLALGEYNIDAELAKKAEKGDNDSITLLEERKNERAEKDLRLKLFGI
jgi:hypothetical protein|nr:MAG TPA: hypothetical protein [Caudoviricetes sp.]DAP57570.1 MAG TPA: hypothetical protein [Caudoviricetes sp.]DAW70911.1 MAG TPA: hypothetical protein [Caudoviricetes sp.]